MATREFAPANGALAWFGYTDYEFVGPDGSSVISLPYDHEPPRGDSLHKVRFSSRELPGFAWGTGLAWSPCGRFVLFEYSSDRRELSRATAVLDLLKGRICAPVLLMRVSRFVYPDVFVRTDDREALAYTLSKEQEWQRVP
jgi:hypothetical protein